jgi:AcrR family transcriptional regulator
VRGEQTRERILREALRLFGEEGYKGATVADIEAAAGLKPGSGALFAHFPTKESVLVTAIEELAAQTRAGRSLFDLGRLGDLRSELIVFARGALLALDANRDLTWVWLRESNHFPHIQTLMEREVHQPAVSWLADWLGETVKAGALAAHDCEAVGVIAVGAITSWWLWRETAGEERPAVDEDRFVEAFVDLLMRLAPPTAASRPKPTKARRP